jgi:hypothetical protein
MSDRKDNDRSGALYCSFCGKTEDQVEQLITGPGVCICNECVMLCDAMLNETPMLRHSNPKGDRCKETTSSPLGCCDSRFCDVDVGALSYCA